MSSHHTDKFFRTFYRQKENAQTRREQRRVDRFVAFETRRAEYRSEIHDMSHIQWLMALLVGLVGVVIGCMLMSLG